MTPFSSICILLLALAGAPQSATQDRGLLPPNGFLQTWNRPENPRIFTASDLYGYIDGGAEIFLEFGFEQLTVQPYLPGKATGSKVPADEFKVEIYRMADPVAAAGIYLMNCGKESQDPSFPERHSLNQFQLIFKRDRYYVIINNSEGNEKLRPAMLEFGRYVATRLPADTAPKTVELLPQSGLIKSSVRLIRGPYALQSVFTLGSGDILQLGRKILAVSGNYEDAGGKHSLVLVDYPTEAAAQKALLNVQANLDNYLKMQEKSERRLVFKDFNNEYGVVSVAGKRLTVQVHLSKYPK
jgi:hypothetical protein